jgi:SAM-dependent methyltransferase
LKTLDEIGIANQTDKASQFSRTYAKPHDYLRHLEKFFEPLRYQLIKFLEIGVGGGESIRTWLEYFPHASVWGIDNVQSTNDWNTVGKRFDPRYCFVFGDQTDETFYKCFAVDYGFDWDVIIDDGAHYNNTVILSFTGLWPLLKSGGLYVIEDLGTAYGGDTVFVKPGFPNHVEWLKSMIDDLNQGKGEVDSIYFSKELAILRKK